TRRAGRCRTRPAASSAPRPPTQRNRLGSPRDPAPPRGFAGCWPHRPRSARKAWLRLPPEREVDSKRRAGAGSGVDADITVVLVHDPLDDRESKPAPVTLRRESGLEKLSPLLRGEPPARVGHGELQA